MATPQINQQVINKPLATFASETDHVTFMSVVAAQLATLLAEIFSPEKQI